MNWLKGAPPRDTDKFFLIRVQSGIIFSGKYWRREWWGGVDPGHGYNNHWTTEEVEEGEGRDESYITVDESRITHYCELPDFSIN